jgi:hypothetical protein
VYGFFSQMNAAFAMAILDLISRRLNTHTNKLENISRTSHFWNFSNVVINKYVQTNNLNILFFAEDDRYSQIFSSHCSSALFPVLTSLTWM